jgi:two-component system, NtrC family, response regulator AtoC
MHRVLVVDDEESIRVMLRAMLRKRGYEVAIASSGREALEEMDREVPDICIVDVRMPQMSGIDLIGEMRERGYESVVVVMSAYGSLESAVEAMKAGAYDYITKPFKSDEVALTLLKIEEREQLRRENVKLRKQLEKDSKFEGIIAQSQVMDEIFRTVTKVAAYKSTVLITGESGTGKELIARAIHTKSPRVLEPFVAVNCGAIPETLLESELFGHKRGAFTDATFDKKGLFEEADGGSLFLDEIGELPLSLQVKLLRALQEETIRRLGDTKDTRVNVRIIAATVRDLTDDVKTGRFREDLFYRINVLPLRLPPLRERREDIPLLIDHFIKRNNVRLGTDVKGVSPDARKLLLDYSWHGNVRELENAIERAMVLAEESTLRLEDLPIRITESRDPIRRILTSGELSIKKTTRYLEEELIRRALKKKGGNRTNAAKILEISHRALLYKIKEYGLK